jgi:hypothetical protein
MRKLRNSLSVILPLSLLLLGCDPGYQLHPVDWQPVNEYTWSKNFGDFEIRTGGLHGLIGEWWVDPGLEIHNSVKPISVQSAELRTANESFEAEIYGDEAIPPGKEHYHLPVSWEFSNKRAAPRVLGTHCEILLNLKVGSEDRQIKIVYEK